jgi:hypothetical protein
LKTITARRGVMDFVAIARSQQKERAQKNGHKQVSGQATAYSTRRTSAASKSASSTRGKSTSRRKSK